MFISAFLSSSFGPTAIEPVAENFEYSQNVERLDKTGFLTRSFFKGYFKGFKLCGFYCLLLDDAAAL